MQTEFDYRINPGRIVFGDGSLERLAELIVEMKGSRALLLSTPEQQIQAEHLQQRLGELGVALYSQAAMHTPVEVTEDALQTLKASKADILVAIGGGSTIGLGKALAYRTDLPQIVIPTTYAGSEVTPILGQTENGVKKTVSHPSILPELVIYDPQLTHSLPLSMSICSALNAMAHAAEALYARNRNPISSLMAAEGIAALVEALPQIVADSHSENGRRQALYGAWLCGSVLGTVGMALHHKLCHTLGGSFDLPHAETHAVILPHAIAFNEVEVGELLQPIARALGSNQAGTGLYAYAQKIGAPLSLKALGMSEEGIARAAELAVANPYWNPRSFDQAHIQRLIENAYHGREPESMR